MTVCEFFGCTFLAFGPPFAMFVFTIASDPVRIIILIAAAFFWLLSLLLSSLLWFAVVPLRKELAFGLVFSVFCQEAFRYIIYKILRKAENGFKKISDDSATLIENKHILAYVSSGLGFGIMSGAFSLVNVVADAVGPGTMGLKSGNEMFFISSAAITNAAKEMLGSHLRTTSSSSFKWVVCPSLGSTLPKLKFAVDVFVTFPNILGVVDGVEGDVVVATVAEEIVQKN
nr:unnamed protein product [Callosobruchus analis]